MCQSAFSSDDYAKKDKCLVRPMSALSVSKSSTTDNGENVNFLPSNLAVSL